VGGAWDTEQFYLERLADFEAHSSAVRDQVIRDVHKDGPEQPVLGHRGVEVLIEQERSWPQHGAVGVRHLVLRHVGHHQPIGDAGRHEAKGEHVEHGVGQEEALCALPRHHHRRHREHQQRQQRGEHGGASHGGAVPARPSLHQDDLEVVEEGIGACRGAKYGGQALYGQPQHWHLLAPPARAEHCRHHQDAHHTKLRLSHVYEAEPQLSRHVGLPVGAVEEGDRHEALAEEPVGRGAQLYGAAHGDRHEHRADAVAAVVKQLPQRRGGARAARLLAVDGVHGLVHEQPYARQQAGPARHLLVGVWTVVD